MDTKSKKLLKFLKPANIAIKLILEADVTYHNKFSKYRPSAIVIVYSNGCRLENILFSYKLISTIRKS